MSKTVAWYERPILFILPPAVAVSLFIGVSYRANQFAVTDTVVLASIADKFLIDTLLYIGLVSILAAKVRQRVAAMMFASLYLAAYFLDAGVYWFCQCRFERHLIFLVRPESMAAFLVPRVIMLAIGWIASAALAATIIARSEVLLRRFPALLSVVLAMLLWTANVPRAFVDYSVRRNSLEGTVDETSIRHQWQELSFLRSNNLFHTMRELLSNRDAQATVRSDVELTRLLPALRSAGLGFGKRSYPEVEGTPFKKIVLVTLESLSLDFLAPYNRELPMTLTPFLGAAEQESRMFTKYYSSRVPTLQGLAAMIHSHPNAELFLKDQSASQALSVVWRLREQGYETIHIRGSSRYFAFESVVFKDWGFSEFLSKETFMNDYDPQYIGQWGLVDRFVFDETIHVLKRSAEPKQFVHVLTVDTHLPHGRDSYGELTYPTQPETGIARGEGRRLLESVSKLDYDLSYFVARLKEEGLWNDDLLLILTADHCCPRSVDLDSIPNYPLDPLCRIPLLFLSSRKLPEPDRERLGSQVDFAPTLFHLLNREAMPGWWGESLFADRPGRAIGMFSDVMRIQSPERDRRFVLGQAGSAEERLIRSAYESIFK